MGAYQSLMSLVDMENTGTGVPVEGYSLNCSALSMFDADWTETQSRDTKTQAL